MKHDAERAREIGSRLLQSKVWAEARERYINDATQQDFENHLIRVAGEQAALLAFAQQPEGWRPIEGRPEPKRFLCAYKVRGDQDYTVSEAVWSDERGCPTSVNGFLIYDNAGQWRPLPTPPAAMLDAALIPGEEK